MIPTFKQVHEHIWPGFRELGFDQGGGVGNEDDTIWHEDYRRGAIHPGIGGIVIRLTWPPDTDETIATLHLYHWTDKPIRQEVYHNLTLEQMSNIAPSLNAKWGLYRLNNTPGYCHPIRFLITCPNCGTEQEANQSRGLLTCECGKDFLYQCGR